MARKSVSRPKKIVHWTDADLKTLRQNAGKKSLVQLGRILKRSTHAVEQHASKHGISLRQKAA